MKMPALHFLLSEQTGLRKNILWVVVSRFGTQGLAVLFTLVLARRLGSAAFGVYALIAAVVFVGNALSTFGTDMLLIREIASREDLSQLMPVAVIQLVLSSVLIAVVWAGAPLLPNQSPESIMALQIYSLALLPLSFFSVFTTALRGRQRMDSYTALNLGVSALQLIAVWTTVRPGGSIVRLAEVLLLVQCAGAVLGALLCAVNIPRFWASWHFSWNKTASLILACAPIALITLTTMLYQKISVYMVSAFIGPAPTGWFSAALRVIEAAKTIHLAVFTALYPAMAQAAAQVVKTTPAGEIGMYWKKPWQGPFQQSWKLLLSGAVAASLVLSIFAGPIVHILYGSAYAPAIGGLRGLSLILIPFTVNTFFSLAMLASHQEQAVMRVQLAGLVVLVGLNVWWIPMWGIEGACLSFVVAETVQSLLFMLSGKIRQLWQGRLDWRSQKQRAEAGGQADITERTGERI